MKAKRAKVPALPEKEARLAAKFFTLSNLGQDVRGKQLSVRGIEQAFHQLAEGAASEGCPIDEEHRSWMKEFGVGGKPADAYFASEWAKEKAKIAGLEALS